jgi:hypothetical protein
LKARKGRSVRKERAARLAIPAIGGRRGPAGPKGEAGIAGPKGDQGAPGASAGLRIVTLGASDCSADGCTVTCEAGEVLASAVCISDTPVQPAVQASAAKCGPAQGMNAICARQ